MGAVFVAAAAVAAAAATARSEQQGSCAMWPTIPLHSADFGFEARDAHDAKMRVQGGCLWTCKQGRVGDNKYDADFRVQPTPSF